jgi:geranylgeranyl diphosphate synthase type II
LWQYSNAPHYSLSIYNICRFILFGQKIISSNRFLCAGPFQGKGLLSDFPFSVYYFPYTVSETLDILNSDPLHLLRQHGQEVEGYLRALADHYPATPPRLMESMQYSLLAGGKRLRPALVMESFKAAGGDPYARPAALAAAAAMELIHTFSLVHDDLPAMDDDDLRRGQPTNHKVFGQAIAILSGDAMTVVAFDLLARRGRDRAADLIAELASAAGPEGMIGGQTLDIEAEHQSLSISRLRRLHGMKTGALLRAACRMGAIAASANSATLTALTACGEHLGLAFQIVDDLLDLTATAQQMGKSTRKDAAKGKNTYPALIGLEAARQQAFEQLTLALNALALLGDSATGLRALAQFVVNREN